MRAGRAAAAHLGDALQGVYARDRKARSSETVKASILETLGLLVEAAPEVAQCSLTLHLRSPAMGTAPSPFGLHSLCKPGSIIVATAPSNNVSMLCLQGIMHGREPAGQAMPGA